LIVRKLEPANRTLWDNYNPIIRKTLEEKPQLPLDVLSRQGTVAPTDENLRTMLGLK
jgi:hypothetical protein